MMKRLVLPVWLIGICIPLFWQCDQNAASDEVVPDSTIQEKVYAYMSEWYYWNDQMPSVNPNQCAGPNELLQAIKYKPIDRYSFITDFETFRSFFQQGEFEGFGFGLKLDNQNRLMLSYVYNASSAGAAGLERGDQILQIGSQPVEVLLQRNQLNDVLDVALIDLWVQKRDGSWQDLSLIKGTVALNPILHQQVFEDDETKTGYLVLNTFNLQANRDLQQAFADFRAKGVNELVLDLRYNSGGTLITADTLASLIRKPVQANEVMLEVALNQDLSFLNETIFFKSLPNTLDLQRLFVITTNVSASASEMIINALRPYMTVTTIGSRTNGKPVGQTVRKIEDLAVGPVVFKVNNSEGKAEYFDGIPADIARQDNLNQPFGSIEEDCLAAALAIIRGEPLRLSQPDHDAKSILPSDNFQKMIGAF